MDRAIQLDDLVVPAAPKLTPLSIPDASHYASVQEDEGDAKRRADEEDDEESARKRARSTIGTEGDELDKDRPKELLRRWKPTPRVVC